MRNGLKVVLLVVNKGTKPFNGSAVFVDRIDT
jgi:hypothetical protein